MTIIVTGGAGFIRGNFIHYHLKEPHEDRAVRIDKLTYVGYLSTLASAMDNPSFYFCKLDICDRDGAFQLFEEEKTEAVTNFETGSPVDTSIERPGSFLHTNTIGISVMMDACRKFGDIRYHQVNTDAVYGGFLLDCPDLFFTEETPIHTTYLYSSSKSRADLLALTFYRTNSLSITISRCSKNYGPYHFSEKLIPRMIANCRNDKLLHIYAEGLIVRDWIYVEGHCKVIGLIVRNGHIGEVYNVDGHNVMQNIDIVKLIIKELEKGEELITYVTDCKGQELRHAIVPTKIHNRAWQVSKTKFQDGIKKTIA